jgi:hypothetical protein
MSAVPSRGAAGAAMPMPCLRAKDRIPLQALGPYGPPVPVVGAAQAPHVFTLAPGLRLRRHRPHAHKDRGVQPPCPWA